MDSKKRPFKRFYEEIADRLPELNPTDQLLYMRIRNACEDYHEPGEPNKPGICFIKNSTFAEKLHVSRPAISRSIIKLQALGLIIVDFDRCRKNFERRFIALPDELQNSDWTDWLNRDDE